MLRPFLLTFGKQLVHCIQLLFAACPPLQPTSSIILGFPQASLQQPVIPSSCPSFIVFSLHSESSFLQHIQSQPPQLIMQSCFALACAMPCLMHFHLGASAKARFICKLAPLQRSQAKALQPHQLETCTAHGKESTNNRHRSRKHHISKNKPVPILFAALLQAVQEEAA